MAARTRHALRTLLGFLGLFAAMTSANGQQSSSRAGRCATGDRVTGIEFIGRPKFAAVEMAPLIVNEAPTLYDRLTRSAKYLCIDTLEVQRDALRIAVLHRQHGWFLANVAPRYERRKDGTRILFDVSPGPLTRIDTVVVQGLPVLENNARPFDGPLRELTHQAFDRVRVQGMVDTVVNLLRDAGYARATQPTAVIAIDTASATDSTPGKVRLTFMFNPGSRLRVGEIHVRIQGIGNRRTVDSADIMSLMRLRPGQRFRATSVLNAQRDLYRTDAFRLVLIDTIQPRLGSADSVIDFQVTVAEARTRYVRAGVGWATQDCGRVQVRAQDRAFLSPGRRADITLRASKLGIGQPVGFAPSLCSGSLRDDPFSEKLNYYFGATTSNTRFFGYPFAPVASLYSERRGEPHAYLRETEVGGLFELSSTLWRRTVYTAGLQYERGRTISDPLVSCTRFGLCQPNDEDVSLFGRGVGVLSTALTHDRTNSASNPSYGSHLRGELRAGATSTSTRQNVHFYRGTSETSVYAPLLAGIVAVRFQLSRVFAPDAPVINGAALIPQQERLFAGGQSSVRGFSQNLLGPVVYAFKDSSRIETVARGEQKFLQVKAGSTYNLVVPRGGTALVVTNLEWRRRVRWPTNKLQIVIFTDAGTLYEAGEKVFHWHDVRITPGFGARLDTPLGPFRLDIGYNPYEQVRGRALFFTGNTRDGKTVGAIQCVTPNNTSALSTTGVAPLDLSRCPETFQPPSGGLFSRLVFHFSLGQAF